MFRKILVFFSLTLTAFSLHAQTKTDLGIYERVLGFRGALVGELSFQQVITGISRIEADFGIELFNSTDEIDFYPVKLSATYQWVLPVGIQSFFYAGPGLSVNYSAYTDSSDVRHADITPLIIAQAGLEYDFDNGLQISLDLRPEISFINDALNFYVGPAGAIRIAI